MMTIDEVDAFARGLPGVTVGTKWGNRTWMVGDKGFAWQRPLTKADLARLGDEPAPRGDLLAVRVEDLDAKDALLAIAPPGFFTIAHFNGYAAVLIELRKAHKKDVRSTVLAAYGLYAADEARRPARKPRRSRPRARARRHDR
ncbi:MAG TPA: MmcQ/YjbR family DNA-binding protein [Kofleriaceae bacterium]|nr:MmcQ/YjbR family DNA-binding protein [Kofleriaceae bacterium]